MNTVSSSILPHLFLCKDDIMQGNRILPGVSIGKAVYKVYKHLKCVKAVDIAQQQ